jgi:AmmeMemoRadiSam system protein B
MTTMRPPAVAGMFYEADPERLRAQVARCYSTAEPAEVREPAIGAVVPHAGLMYSGHVAAALYAIAAISKRLIILCPNHTGAGRPAAMYKEGKWLMPFGPVPVDKELASELAAETSLLEQDVSAHAREHSLEVQLPFLQESLGSFAFVPICLAAPRYAWCEEIGGAIARVVERHRERSAPISIIASSDLNHYENQQTTLRKDQRAIDRILELDPRGLWDVVEAEDISMCGFIPTTTMLIAANQLGATKARLIRHATSGDINGDYSAVVGYASILIS